MRSEEIHVGDLLTECRGLKEAAAEENGITLHTHHSGDGDFVYGDRKLLRTAMSNLIDVAMAHSRRGGNVTIGYRHDPVRGSMVVSDDGAGIPFEELRSMFDIVSRPGFDDVYEGDGMGADLLRLSIVRDVAELHGGRIGVRSAEGEGSTFTLHLPCRHTAAPSRSSR